MTKTSSLKISTRKRKGNVQLSYCSKKTPYLKLKTLPSLVDGKLDEDHIISLDIEIFGAL